MTTKTEQKFAEFRYDAVGNTTALIDARGNRHSFVYDAADREIALVDPLSRRTTSGYDAAGNQTLRIDARGNRTTYSFDANSQLTARSYPDGSRATFAYDATGNRTLMHDATGRYTKTYDAVSQTTVNQLPNSKTISYSYDAVGNRSVMIDPDGGRFTYSYDGNDLLTTLVNPQSDRTSYSYDVASRRTLKKLANDTRTSFGYDTADQLTSLYNMKSDSSVSSSFDYSYDDAGNRKSVLESDSSRVTWSYDATNQLLVENRTGTNPYVNTFTYDAAQNRLTKSESGSTTTFSYDSANQLSTSENVTGTTNYTFDANGNQQIVVAPDSSRTTTTWDYENQPTKVELPSGTVNTSTYNAENLRTEILDSTGTKRFVWDGQQYLLETDETNTTQSVWTNEPGEFTTLISQRRAGATQYPHFDALGSTRELTDSAESSTDTWIYDAWGNIINRTGTTNLPFQFVGMHGYFTDSDTGTTYVIERVYSPVSARWLSLDLLRFLDEINAYLYVGNNSTNSVDPSGLLEEDNAKGILIRCFLKAIPKIAGQIWRRNGIARRNCKSLSSNSINTS